jgi:hypothetical protein
MEIALGVGELLLLWGVFCIHNNVGICYDLKNFELLKDIWWQFLFRIVDF